METTDRSVCVHVWQSFFFCFFFSFQSQKLPITSKHEAEINIKIDEDDEIL